MESKRAILVVVSALPHNGVLYEYGMRLARDEGARTLLVDYHQSVPAGWVPDRGDRPALSDMLAGRAEPGEVAVESAACQRFHIACGMGEAPDRHVPVATAVLREEYDAVMVLTPLHARHAAEWFDWAEAVLLACTSDAADSEAVRQSLGRLRERGVYPQLLVDCRDSDEAAAHREASGVAARLGLRLWAILERSDPVRAAAGGSASDAAARGKAIKQLDDAARRKSEELTEAWDWIYGHDPASAGTADQAQGAEHTKTGGAEGAEHTKTGKAEAAVTVTAEPGQAVGHSSDDRMQIHLAVDQLLDMTGECDALMEQAGSMAARMELAEQEARALHEEPLVMDDGSINPRYIERLARLHQVKEEYGRFRVENRLDDRKAAVEEKRAIVRRLLGLN